MTNVDASALTPVVGERVRARGLAVKREDVKHEDPSPLPSPRVRGEGVTAPSPHRELDRLRETARLRRQLTARLARLGYEFERRDVRVGGHLVVPFTQIRDPDRVLDSVVEEADRRERVTGRKQSDDELHLPYWAELWDSALGVAEHLVASDHELRKRRPPSPCTQGEGGGEGTSATQQPALSPSLSPTLSQCTGRGRQEARLAILDLGCGVGFAGTVAAMLGHRVTFADIETPALLFARLNSIAWRERVSARRVDWKRDRLNERFDVILGADVLYDRSQWEHLEPFWRAHLRDDTDACVLLGEPGRQTGDLFESWITARGWCLSRSEVRVITRELPIRLFRIAPLRLDPTGD